MKKKSYVPYRNREYRERYRREQMRAISINDIDCEKYAADEPKAIQCPKCKNIYCIKDLSKNGYFTGMFDLSYYYDCPGCDVNLWC